jgi:AcrR family transcriptional regulator
VEAARQSLAEASRELLRDRVLDAVGEVASAKPWGEATMAEIALAAGVSRQTLYNSFGSRQELAQAYVLREGDRFVAAVESAIRTNAPDARAALRAAVEIFLTAAETHPVIKAVVASESGDELLPLLTTRGGPLVDEVTDRLAQIILESWPGVPRREAGVIADCLARLAISHAALPADRPDRTAKAIAEVLGPYVDQVIEELGARRYP